jgi:hypothetical protein
MTDALFDPDKPYRARNGWPARIVDQRFMLKNVRCTLVIYSKPNGNEEHFLVFADGRAVQCDYDLDLVNYTPERKISAWANIYADSIALWKNDKDAGDAALTQALAAAVLITFTIREDGSVTVSGGRDASAKMGGDL